MVGIISWLESAPGWNQLLVENQQTSCQVVVYSAVKPLIQSLVAAAGFLWTPGSMLQGGGLLSVDAPLKGSVSLSGAGCSVSCRPMKAALSNCTNVFFLSDFTHFFLLWYRVV